MDELPLFRGPKRRKTTQIRHASDEPVLPPEEDGGKFEAPDGGDEDHVSKLVRARKLFRSAKSGVIFSTTSRLDGEESESMAPVPVETSNGQVRDMSNRFVGSTGQVADADNNHMTAYIDSKMAKRHQTTPLPGTQDLNSTASALGYQPQTITHDKTATQPQSHQLSEVDLSCLPKAALKAATNAPSKRPLRKPRLGRDGKALRPRPGNRRNSEDIARDALVEQVLHEHKLENVYQPPNPNTGPENQSAVNPEAGDAGRDEVFAERFRQDFLDQVAERRQAQQQKKTAASVAAPEKTQGPKLGGSRSARARLAAMQQEQQHGGGVGLK